MRDGNFRPPRGADLYPLVCKGPYSQHAQELFSYRQKRGNLIPFFNMKKEEWKKIPGFPRYEVSDRGRIRSDFGKGKILKPSLNDRGYHKIGLSVEGKRYTRKIHRLVLEAFVGPCPEGMECSHLDGKKTNNRLGNLEWATQWENDAMKFLHGTTNQKLDIDKVKEIRRRSAGGENYASLGREFGVAGRTIRGVVLREHWKWVA